MRERLGVLFDITGDRRSFDWGGGDGTGAPMHAASGDEATVIGVAGEIWLATCRMLALGGLLAATYRAVLGVIGKWEGCL